MTATAQIVEYRLRNRVGVAGVDKLLASIGSWNSHNQGRVSLQHRDCKSDCLGNPRRSMILRPEDAAKLYGAVAPEPEVS